MKAVKLCYVLQLIKPKVEPYIRYGLSGVCFVNYLKARCIAR